MLKTAKSIFVINNLNRFLTKRIEFQRFTASLNNTVYNYNFHQFYATDALVSRTLFIPRENTFAYGILKPLIPLASSNRDRIPSKKVISCGEEFRTFLDRDWRKCDVEVIIRGFEDVLNYSKANNIDISNCIFDKIVDGLLDNIEHLTKEGIVRVLRFLSDLPFPEGVTAHNYHDVWSALDDVCCWRLREWNLNESLQVAELWYKLGLGRICDFIYELLEKYSKKPEKLSKHELVHIFFYFNVCRKRNMDFSYENAVERKINSMNPDEIGIVAMGFFKTQTKVKSLKTLNVMLDCAINNLETIHEITLASIIKVIRMSQNPLTAEKILEFLKKVTSQIDRLSNLSCLHVALLGTSLQIYHPETLDMISQKLSKELSDTKSVRIKDIERFLLALTMFDHEPKIISGNIYELLLKELYNPDRKDEIEKYPKCLVCALLYLSIRDIYPEDLVTKVLSTEFIHRVYGKKYSDIQRELFTLDLSVEIDRYDYKGPRIPIDFRWKCARYFIEYLPNQNKRNMPATDRFIHDLLEKCTNVAGDSNNVFLGHILPHFTKADIVLCYDNIEKKFVKPPIEMYRIGDVVYPVNLTRYKWFVIMPIALNTTIKFVLRPVGIMKKKERQLKKLGYHPVLIPFHEYLCLDDDSKLNYIHSKIKAELT